MIRLKEFFKTDFNVMTASDVIGMIITVFIFVSMVIAYVYAFHPKNRERLNSYGDIPLNDGHFEKKRDVR